MSENDTLRTIIANWKYAWAKQMQGQEKSLGKYEKLPQSLQELETLIKQELKKGGVLQAYAEINQEWNEVLTKSLYEEIMGFYELCEGTAYFDIAEVEELLKVDYKGCWKNTEEFVQNCMNIVIKAPMKIQEKNKLYDIQRHVFRLAKDEDVWYAYEQKKLFPKEILETLYEQIEDDSWGKKRAAWIIAWLNN